MTAPLRWRLALTFTVGLALVLITGAAAFALILQRGYREDFDRELFEVAHASRDLYQLDRTEYPTRDAVVAHIVSELLLGERTIIAYDTTGRRIAVSQHLPGSPDLDHLDPFATPETPTDARQHGKDIRVLAVPMPDGLRFVIGQPNAPYRARIRVLQLSLAVGLPILLLLGGALGVVLAKPALRPVGRVADAAEAVGEAVIRGDSQLPRLTPPDTQDEVRQLTDAFNDLLARLEIGFERERGLAARQRAFLADAAQELRTPIAIVRSEADAALASPTGPAVERAVLVRIAAEADRLGRPVSETYVRVANTGPDRYRFQPGERTVISDERYTYRTESDTAWVREYRNNLGLPYREQRHAYDQWGYLRSIEDRYLVSGRRSRVSFRYDEKGRLAERIVRPDLREARSTMETYRYDPAGNLTTREVYHDDRHVRHEEYLYEEHTMFLKARIAKDMATGQIHVVRYHTERR